MSHEHKFIYQNVFNSFAWYCICSIKLILQVISHLNKIHVKILVNINSDLSDFKKKKNIDKLLMFGSINRSNLINYFL